MSHKIDITENGTTTLLTEGKYCDRNIEVNVNIASSGGTEIEDGLISGTLSGAYRNDRVTKVGDYALASQKLTSVDLPNATHIGYRSFGGCSNLTQVNAPNVETLGGYSFVDCSALTSIDFPNIVDTGNYEFGSCKSLVTVNLPNLTRVRENLFTNCVSIKKLDFPSVTQIGYAAIYNNYSLVAVILRAESVCDLTSSTVFKYCYHFLGTVNTTYNPEGLKDGYIYVPKNLIEQYKVATNWATYADQFRAIEDYPEITGG